VSLQDDLNRAELEIIRQRERAEWWACMARKLMAERDGDTALAHQLAVELAQLTPAH
jgi:hypothetical protein